MEWFPLDKAAATKEGFAWRDPEAKDYQDATVVLPEHIRDVSEAVLKEILKCKQCGKNYRLIRMEFDFYKKFNLPVPEHCPLCRDRARTRMLNPIEIHDRECMKCNKPIKTSWSKDRPEIVYCAECYRQEVY